LGTPYQLKGISNDVINDFDFDDFNVDDFDDFDFLDREFHEQWVSVLYADAV